MLQLTLFWKPKVSMWKIETLEEFTQQGVRLLLNLVACLANIDLLKSSKSRNPNSPLSFLVLKSSHLF